MYICNLYKWAFQNLVKFNIGFDKILLEICKIIQKK